MFDEPSTSLVTTRTAHPDWTLRAWFFNEIKVRHPLEIQLLPGPAAALITGTALGWSGSHALAMIPLAAGVACTIGAAALWLFLGRTGRLPDWAVSSKRRYSLFGLWRAHRRARHEAQPPF